MRKKILLFLLLVIGSAAMFAQSINVDVTGDFSISSGDILSFGVSPGTLSAGVTIKIECTDAPSGVILSDFTQEKLVSIEMLGLELIPFDNMSPTVVGGYTYVYSTITPAAGGVGEPVIGSVNSFINTVTDPAVLSSTTVKSIDFFVVYDVSSETLKLHYSDVEHITGVSVINLAGSVLFSSNHSEDSIGLSFLPSGVYVISVEENGGKTTKKFVKN
ncbi:T9SS type A sorting domain-containing protein [Wenyingzhuangia sp. 2_MG-2023]|uniref:T9SS type A sorting domain-containing protein n=1 Tax=Wenyingzhuangia sp. 2_MG-2023 TaxID=3062639 RepID=UPI0026E229CE|nr:T9SS type A sorting domain-containing protein [Wenyingzhuangia sp. 2_MG-2023]MDO6738114.1 T9SS type A sorting domain-containing protein [Wenyingzhuangia sp. 2_MG-2023]